MSTVKKIHRLLTCLTILLICQPCFAQVGLYIRPGFSSIASPVPGQSYVFNSINNTINAWNGSSWLAISAPQNNFTATTAPTSANDNTQGYTPGSAWYNTSTGFTYQLVNAATSAAIWVQTNNLGSLSIPLTSLQQGGATIGQSLLWNGISWSPGSPSISLNNILQTGALPGQVPVWNGTNYVPQTFPGSGGVSYVGLSMPSDLFSVSGSPITSSGMFTVTENNQPEFLVYSGPNFANFPTSGAFRQISQRHLLQTIPQQIVSPNGILPTLPMGFSYTPGAITEYAIAANPSALCTGPDSNIWISMPSINAIAVMDLSGAILNTYTIPNSGIAQAICYGPDGNVYFTDPINSAIGQITTAGVITEFTISRTTSNMPGICVGDDGRIWATAHDTNGYWYGMTTAGTISEYGPGDGSLFPTYICNGPDNALWMTDDTNNNIISTDYAGGFQFFTVFPGTPGQICAGPNNNVWFTVPGSNQIGRVDAANFASGNMIFYNITTSSSVAAGICATPDGGCFFTETAGNNFGHINAFGVVTETALTTPSAAPVNLCVGADGAVYCAETTVSQIGIQALTQVHR